MSKQAKTLTAVELRRVLDYIATRKHAERNRACLLTMMYAGLRVCEASSLRYENILEADGNIRREFRLEPDQTKGSKVGTVFIGEKLRKELQAYVKAVPPKDIKHKLFYSQKSAADGFSANSLTQFFHYLFKDVGIAGASSHSPRRSFITNLAAKGVGARVLQKLARHEALSTTQKYIDVNDDMLRKACELV